MLPHQPTSTLLMSICLTSFGQSQTITPRLDSCSFLFPKCFDRSMICYFCFRSWHILAYFAVLYKAKWGQHSDQSIFSDAFPWHRLRKAQKAEVPPKFLLTVLFIVFSMVSPVQKPCDPQSFLAPVTLAFHVT